MGLSLAEMAEMELGQALDFMAEYVKQHKQESEPRERVRKATQADFDAF